MQNFIVRPAKKLMGELQVPGDKSISHRALMLAAIADGQSIVNGLLMGADNLATMHALQQLGVNIKQTDKQQIIIDGVGLHGLQAPNNVLDLGNSGTGIRILTGLLAGQSFNSELTGDESLRRRPMQRIVDPLTQMGACVEMSCDNTPPLQIEGNVNLHGIKYAMPVASAQVKSCVLLAGLYADGKTCVIESAPTRDHTERMLQTCGYPIEINKNKICLPGGHPLSSFKIDIPGDISSAAFFIVAATITPNSEILLTNVGINPTRVGVINILKLMGADITLKNERSAGNEPVADILVRSAKLNGIEIPIEQVSLTIDEFPVLFIAAACASGKTILRGAKELRVKESDRIAAMAEGLKTCGIKNEVLDDGIIIEGGQLQGGTVNSFGDHRIAMAFAVAGCVAMDSITIQDCQNVETSFPNFVNQLTQLNIPITTVTE